MKFDRLSEVTSSNVMVVPSVRLTVTDPFVTVWLSSSVPVPSTFVMAPDNAAALVHASRILAGRTTYIVKVLGTRRQCNQI